VLAGGRWKFPHMSEHSTARGQVGGKVSSVEVEQ